LEVRERKCQEAGENCIMEDSEMVREFSTHEMRNVYKIMIGKLKTNVARETRRVWEDNIRTDLTEIGWERVKWIHMAQDRNQWRTIVYTVMNLQVPSKPENFLNS
jgi:hypothetical protein